MFNFTRQGLRNYFKNKIFQIYGVPPKKHQTHARANARTHAHAIPTLYYMYQQPAILCTRT